MSERMLETRVYPESIEPISKFTAFESSKPFDTPEAVQAKKAAKASDDTAIPTKLFVDDDFEKPSPSRKASRLHLRANLHQYRSPIKPIKPIHFRLSKGDSSDEDLKEVVKQAGPPTSSSSGNPTSETPWYQEKNPTVPKKVKVSQAPPTVI